MRTVPDRIRHTLSFEVIGLALIIPLGHRLFGLSHEAMGVVGVGSAVAATVWNYLYNPGFDRLMLRWTGSLRKSIAVRVAHAVLFEAGLLVLLLPPIAWYLGMSLWNALVMDLAIAGFYVAYAFCFNWIYDRVFPVPGLRHA